MIRRIGIFSVFILLGFSSALAGVTGILEGTVKEKQSGLPLVGANVLIIGTEQGAATDADGFFQVPNVRAGAYQVRVSWRWTKSQSILTSGPLSTCRPMSRRTAIYEAGGQRRYRISSMGCPFRM